jgi:hypothetical protein
MLPGGVGAPVGRYLRQVDMAIPGAIHGFYVVGSIALGAFRPGRSDVDFVAVLGDRLFGDRWRPMIDEALAYWRGDLTAEPFRLAGRRQRESARFAGPF